MDDVLRIAMVMAGTGAGGMEKHTLELSAELAQQGHTVGLLTHPGFASRVSPTVQHLAVDLSRSRRHPGLLFSTWRHLRNFRPDIIHAQANKASAIVTTLRPWLPRCKTVATLHNEKSQIGMFRDFDARIAVSQLSANLLKPWPTHVIYNGIAPTTPLPIETSAWKGLPPGPRVLAVGRLVPAKSFDVLLDAWQSIEAPLVIAGSGPLAEVLQARLLGLGLHNRVRLLGHRDDVAQLMHSAELLVISSRNEGNPYVMIEALHARLPMVSTAVGAIPEILPADALCPPHESAALANRVAQALQDLPATRAQFAPVFERAACEMTLEAMTTQTVAVYRQLAERR